MLLQWQFDAIKHYFERSGTVSGVVYTVMTMGALFALLLVIQRAQMRREQKGGVNNNPQKLFRAVLRRLPLSVVQRDLLQRIASDMRVLNPTVMLLSPVIFGDYAHRWMGRDRSVAGQSPDDPRKLLTELSLALFAEPLPSPTPQSPPSSATEHKASEPACQN